MATSRPVEPLPIEWIERLFERMLTYYGKRFVDQWADAPPELLKKRWAEGLATYSVDEIKRGLMRLDQCTWPPTLPEFKQLCRAVQDYEAAFYEAVRESVRRRDALDTWSDPAIFWAAVRMGHDLHLRPYEALRGRWREALDSALTDIHTGRLHNAVPPARPTHGLPPPPAAPTQHGREVAQAAVESMRAALRRTAPAE